MWRRTRRTIDCDVAVPFLDRKLPRLVPRAHGARRLYQNVEPPKLGRGLIDRFAVDGRGLCEIGLERQRAPAEGANFGCSRFGFCVPITIDERHLGAAARELETHRAPDAAAAAGHQRLFVLEIAHLA